VSDVGIGSWMWRRARLAPDAIAFRQGSAMFSYADVAQRVQALAAGLARHGVHHGDYVAYLGPNDIATFETLFASASIGAVFAPLNTRLPARELAYMVTDCRARLLVHGPECASLAQAVAQQTGVTLVTIEDSGQPDELTYQSLLATGTKPPSVTVGLDDDAVVLYTSGTTGRPKGAVLTHGNLTFNTVNQLAQIDVLGRDVVICTAPLFHVVGLGQVTLPALFKGATVVVAPKFDATWMLATIEELGINAFSAVPTMLQMMCDHPSFPATDLSSVRYVVYGGSPVSPRVAGAWIDRGVPLLQGYGMTEAAPGVLLAMADGVRQHATSAGVPQFFVDYRLRTLDTDDEGTGELLIQGPNVFRGYLNRPADTAAAMTDGWFHTGDVVRMSPDGWGYVIDRTKDMIISGGENIYPAEVEAAIGELAGVVECAVVGVPDERWGEVGLGVVVPMSGTELDDAALRAHLESRLARYKVPKYFEFTDSLPRTATGKIQKSEIRRTSAQHTTTTTER
jgi:fatty-acyl-CoA synthase